MSDAVKGTALIVTRKESTEYLFVVACREGEKPRTISIPVAAEGAQHAHGSEPWRYREDGDKLHMTPSLSLKTNTGAGTPLVEVFHNAYHWTVPFQRFTPDASMADPYEHEWETFLRLNEALLADGHN